MNPRPLLWIGLALTFGLTSAAAAQRGTQGSLLVYPEFDSRNGNLTVLSFTNTSSTTAIGVERTYIAADTCTEFNRSSSLTPNDTYSTLTEFDNPDDDQGFVYVFAKEDVIGGVPITFNHLIGTSTIIDGFRGSMREFEPFSFQGLTGEGAPTDEDSDNLRDLNGIEYQGAADRLVFPRFLGQGYDFDPGNPGNRLVESDLILINLTGTSQFLATVDFLIYNDNEEVSSREFSFQCWSKVSLASITPSFTNEIIRDFTNHDPAEVAGVPGLESGWFRVDGLLASSPLQDIEDPTVLGALSTGIRGSSRAAILPFQVGEQYNGELVQRSAIIRDSTPSEGGAIGLNPSRKP